MVRILTSRRATSAGVFLVALMATGEPRKAWGQTITHGDSTFSQPVGSTTGAGVRTGATGGTAAVMTAGGDATDQLFQQWWWYRVNGVNAREFGFSNRVSNLAAGNVLTLTYVEPEAFDAVIRYTLTDGPNAPAQCRVVSDVTLRTTSATPLSLAVYAYIDYDLEGVAGDSAVLAGPNRIRITDTTGFFGEALGVNANAYQVAPFATVRTNLTDADIDNFANTGLPFAAGDFTGAFQWNVMVVQNNPVTLRFIFSLNSVADPCGGAVLGDANCDGALNNFDIDCFVLALSNGEAAWNVMCNAGGACSALCVLDTNGDGMINNFDIDSFVECLSMGCP